MTRGRLSALAVSVVVIAGAAIGGFALGSAEAPTEQEAKQARHKARLLAATVAEDAAFIEAKARGRRVGIKQGRTAAKRAGTREGGDAGHTAADDELAAIEAEQAAQAAAQLTYDPQLPNGDPGYILPEDQRSISCIGVSAVTGECVGD